LSWTLLFTERYSRRAARFLQRHPELRDTYRKTLLLLEVNPRHPSLRLYALEGRLQGLHSVSINISYRITLELMLIDGQRLIPIDVGSHDAVYRS
jgi:mRNA-degrading endonuclease YafQ of YafQ-DinJ toxin-antitoxin module